MKPTIAHRGVPEGVGWETTLRCNMRCRHCGSTAGSARCEELSTSDALNLCGQMVRMKIPRVILTGGETLLRKDWRVLLDALLDGGTNVGLLTNGWTLTSKLLAELASYQGAQFYLSVSLDGVPEDHDRIRALPGSFTRAFDGALYLRTQGVPVAVITTVSHANIEGMEALRERIFNELQPYCWQIQIANAFGRAAENDDCRVTPIEYARTVCFVSESRRLSKGTKTTVYAGDCLGYLSSIEEGLRDDPWPGCQAGLQIIGIQSNGNVKGCLSIVDDRYVEGNVMKEGLEAIWNRPGAFSYTRCFESKQLKGQCRGCPVGERCRAGCSAASISAYGEAHRAPYCLRAIEATKKEAKKAVEARKGRFPTLPRVVANPER